MSERQLLTEALQKLRAIVTDVDAMRTQAPEGTEIDIGENPEDGNVEPNPHWLGNFARWDAGEDGAVIEWGNLSILAMEAAELCNRMQEYIGETVSMETAETAMCIWEYANISGNNDILQWLNNGEGAAMGREYALKLAPLIDLAWINWNKQGYDGEFDWEFVPAILQQLRLFNVNSITQGTIDFASDVFVIEWKRKNKRG